MSLTEAETERAKRKALVLAALCGSKIALGPAFLSRSAGWPTARNWMLAAIGEMTLDKLGVFPPRWRPSLLLPHTAAGAWTAHESLKEDGVESPETVALAAGIAAVVALSAPLIRIALSKGARVPDVVLGLVEDYLALELGTKTMGVTYDEIGHEARASLEEAKDRVIPALQSAGITA